MTVVAAVTNNKYFLFIFSRNFLPEPQYIGRATSANWDSPPFSHRPVVYSQDIIPAKGF